MIITSAVKRVTLIRAAQIIGCIALAGVSGAEACMADPRSIILSDIDAAYTRYDAIFVGEVISTVRIDSSWQRVVFRVGESVKGSVSEQAELASPTYSICSPSAELGATYLVFASNRPAELPTEPILQGLFAPAGTWEGGLILSVSLLTDSERVHSVLLQLRALSGVDAEE